MPLVTANQLSIRYRGPSLLDDVSFVIEPNQRIGLLGRNGAGKTTLMKMVAGMVQPDHGEIQTHEGIHIAMLGQDVPQDTNGSIFKLVQSGLAERNDWELEPWLAQNKVEQILSRMQLDGEARFEGLSSGMKRRVLLAKALVTEPDLLLLDEPTNHLDIAAIDWLEEFLQKSRFSFLFVTHDRMFLRRLANRILEIDRGRLFDWSCDYDTFLKRKEEALAAEEKQNQLFDKRLAEEEAWIRQGIKARRTRNEGRVRALKAMREEYRERRSKLGTSKLQIQEADRSGRLVVEAKEISFHYPDSAPVFEEFSTTIMRGDKVGVIGPNGAGKSTLLKTILGQHQPTSGQVKLGTNLQIAYFDQLRQQLDLEQSVVENIGQGSDSVVIGGRKKHVLGYLQDFLFSPERARTQVKFLSGGEKNRILLARLFSQPANVIVLDEPTNDLDAETLELLEEKLIEFNGTVIVVSHDREFLNNVVTSTMVFESDGLREYVGGYDDWVRQAEQRNAIVATEAEQPPTTPQPVNKKSSRAQKDGSQKPRKLSYKEKRELEGLPESIEQLESEIAAIHEKMADPEFYQQGGEAIANVQEQLNQLNQQLEQAYQRWESLEQIAEQS